MEVITNDPKMTAAIEEFIKAFGTLWDGHPADFGIKINAVILSVARLAARQGSPEMALQEAIGALRFYFNRELEHAKKNQEEMH